VLKKEIFMKTISIAHSVELEAIINSCDICHIGITDEDGSPYVIPMNFALHGDHIILHSGPTGSHLNFLSIDNRMCVTFTSNGSLVYQHEKVACSYRMDSKSVVCRGRVEFVEDLEQKEELLNVFMKKYSDKSFKYSAPALRNVKIWLFKIEIMTGKAFGQPHNNKVRN
jgi:nitroimidazol reductase NimA-like FMN-containing flavoprotein (pyridoxamine 5'-phosphate oxidase superfamily)